MACMHEQEITKQNKLICLSFILHPKLNTGSREMYG